MAAGAVCSDAAGVSSAAAGARRFGQRRKQADRRQRQPPAGLRDPAERMEQQTHDNDGRDAQSDRLNGGLEGKARTG